MLPPGIEGRLPGKSKINGSSLSADTETINLHDPLAVSRQLVPATNRLVPGPERSAAAGQTSMFEPMMIVRSRGRPK
jgi:hypothetical protein